MTDRTVSTDADRGTDTGQISQEDERPPVPAPATNARSNANEALGYDCRIVNITNCVLAGPPHTDALLPALRTSHDQGRFRPNQVSQASLCRDQAQRCGSARVRSQSALIASKAASIDNSFRRLLLSEALTLQHGLREHLVIDDVARLGELPLNGVDLLPPSSPSPRGRHRTGSRSASKTEQSRRYRTRPSMSDGRGCPGSVPERVVLGEPADVDGPETSANVDGLDEPACDVPPLHCLAT